MEHSHHEAHLFVLLSSRADLNETPTEEVTVSRVIGKKNKEHVRQKRNRAKYTCKINYKKLDQVHMQKKISR